MSYSYTADGNITVSSIVKLSTVSPFRVLQAAAASDNLLGVSSEAVDKAPIPQDTSAQYAAVQNEDLKVYLNGDHCSVTSSGGNTAGDLVTSDSAGNALTTTSATNNIVGRMEDTVVNLALGRIFVNTFSLD